MSLKLSALLLVLSICMCLGFTGHVAYADKVDVNYDNGTLVVSGLNYLSPKVDCNNINCVVIAYDENINRLKLFYSYDGFGSVNYTANVGTDSLGIAVRNDTYPMCYDVASDISDANLFWIVYKNHLYSFNVSSYSLVLNGSQSSNICFMKLNLASNQIIGYGVSDYGSSYFNISRFSVAFPSLSASPTNIGTCANSTSWSGYAEAYGFESGDAHYDIFMNPVNDSVVCRFLNLSGYAESYDGIWHYNNGVIYYRNSTDSDRISTSGWSSFGNPFSVKRFTGYSVDSQDMKSKGGSDVVAFKRNDTGVYFFNTYVQPSYTPAPEYVNATRYYYPALWWLGFKAYSPRVDCQPDMQHCLMLIYDTGGVWFVFPAVIGLYSTDGFNTTASTFYIPSSPVPEISDQKMDYYPLPYDVKYNIADGKYYLVYGNKIYSWSLAQSPNLQTIYTGDSLTKFIGITGKDSGTPYATAIFLPTSLSNHNCETWLRNYFLYNGTIDSYVILDTTYCFGNLCGTGLITYAGGFLDGSDYAVRFKGYHYCSGGGFTYFDTVYKSLNIQTYFPVSYNGFQYYRESSDFVFTRNGSLSESVGQWKTQTSDFQIYVTPYLYYSWDLANGESIPRTDRMLLGTNRLYAFERNHYTSFGIFVYKEPIFPIYVFARYVDPVTGEPDKPVIVNGNLTCPSGFSMTGSGSDLTLHSTCTLSMYLNLLTSQFLPTIGSITFDRIAGCNSAMFIRANYLVESYNATVTVRDQITGQPIGGAVVKINGISSYVTDSNGTANIPVQPVLNPYFVRSTDVGSCTENLQVSGTARSYWIQVNATSYRTSNYYSYKFVNEQVVNNVTYFTYKDSSALNLYVMKGAEVNVKVYTFDGNLVEKNLVSVSSSGANKTYVVIDGVPIQTITATDFPAVFRLTDDRSSYDASFALVQGNHTETKNLTVYNTTNYYSLSFSLPENSSYSCMSSADCTGSYCQGTFFYSLTGCIGDSCVYDVSSCTLCDAEAGCYEQSSSMMCFFNTDCVDVCASLGVLNEGNCGSNHFCLFHAKDCSNGCQSVAEGEAYCAEAPPLVECDQSTTVGMLSCMQAGVMNFIGSTYGSIFIIALVLFIMVLVITVFALAFKGAQNVIR